MNTGLAVMIPLELALAPLCFVAAGRALDSVTVDAEDKWSVVTMILFIVCLFGLPWLGLLR